MSKLKIGYFADGPWSYGVLEKFLSDTTMEVKFICARHERPDLELKKIAEINGIDFLTHSNVNSREFLKLVEGFYCDILVSMSFNQIFKKELINLTSLKAVNCHAGKLPFYRGRNILNWALINDETEFGITVHYIDEGIDTGDIISQRCLPIYENDCYRTLLDRAYEACPDILYSSIKKIQSGKAKRIKQKDIDPNGSYCIARKSGDEILIWNQKSRDIYNFVRAISDPGPSASTFLENFEYKIHKVKFFEKARIFKGIPGSVIGVENNTFYVKTSDSFIKVLEWRGNRKPRIGDRFK